MSTVNKKMSSINLELDFNLITSYINSIEMRFGNYLFDKYVKVKLDKGDIKVDKGDIKVDNKLESKKEINVMYEKFKKKFYYKKKNLITQNEIIKKDIYDITNANNLYSKYNDVKENMDGKTLYGYPDKMRCNYIRMDKHKMQRCKNKISKDDIYDLMCCKHVNLENIYRENYYKLYNKIKLII
jgi:hypothetical protein